MTSKKEILLEILRQATGEATKAEKMGREIVGSARFSLDLAAGMRQTIEVLPSDDSLPQGHWDRYIGTWQDLKNSAVSVNSTGTAAQSLSANVAAIGLTVSSLATDLHSFLLPEPLQKTVKEATETIFHIVDRNHSSYDIVADMKRLQLDTRGGNASTAIELFEQAKAAFERPTFGEGSPIGILIALRESIDAVLEQLITLRPFQEAAKKDVDKVISIGRHCARAGFSLDYFTRLRDDVHKLRDDLSGGKQQAVSRDEMMNLFRRTSLFLKAFLASIDETKLRKLR